MSKSHETQKNLKKAPKKSAKEKKAEKREKKLFHKSETHFDIKKVFDESAKQ